jgi:16S rRNA (cytosine967-C5)-methyltransferase
VQAELLDAAAPLVRPGGGVLVYSTCSIEPEENQQQVRTCVGLMVLMRS